MENLDRYVGSLLDRRYRIHRVIGVGGMAVVFEATDLVMNRTVAVKMLKDEMAHDAQAVARFINESKAVSMLSHPNIVKIFDVSVKGTMKYIVMERIEGITLKSYMQKKGALSIEEVLSYSEQVLRALEHAHSKGIIHRDIKPQNILLLKNGRVKVTDFGIAKLPDAEPIPTDDKAIGTVYYISPEQANGKENLDRRSDLYSLGVLMYEMATGTLPFIADTPVLVAMMQVKDQPKAPTEIKENIPYGLEQIILGAMEKNPDRRFQSAEQMLRYTERLRANPNYVFKTRKASATETADAIIDTTMKKKNVSRRRRTESRSMFPIIFGVSVAFVIVLITGALSILDMVLKSQSTNTPVTVEVPDVIGEIYSSNLEKEFDSSIYKIVIDAVYNADVPQNTIIEQDPKPGSKRKVLKNQQFCTVTLTISKGAEMLTVPDYTILEYRSVVIAAEKLGFRCSLRPISSETVSLGYVVRTDPVAKTPVEYGSELVIYYSIGSTPQKFSVPVLTDLTPMEAYNKMEGNFRVGEVSYAYSDTVVEGRIISQSLPSGTQAVKGTVISFVISLGPEPVTDPPVTDPPVSDSDTIAPDITDPDAVGNITP